VAENNESVTLFTESTAIITEYNGALQRMYQLAGRNIYRSVWFTKLKSCVLLWKLLPKTLIPNSRINYCFWNFLGQKNSLMEF